MKFFNVIISGAMEPNEIQSRIDRQKMFFEKNLTAQHSPVVHNLNITIFLFFFFSEHGFTLRFFKSSLQKLIARKI